MIYLECYEKETNTAMENPHGEMSATAIIDCGIMYTTRPWKLYTLVRLRGEEKDS